jgi:hypothetical protein
VDLSNTEIPIQLHPFLSCLKLAPIHESAIKDLFENIQNTQAETTRAQLEA